MRPATHPVILRVISCLAALLASFTLAARSETLFMQLKGVDGEAVEKEHDKWSVIQSIKRGVSAETSWTKGGGAAVGKPVFDTITIRKRLDTATTSLMGRITTGKSFDQVVLETVRQRPQGSFRYYRIELSNAFVTRDQLTVNGDEASEEVSFVFKSFKWAYIALDAESAIASGPQSGQTGNLVTGFYDNLGPRLDLPLYEAPPPPTGRLLENILNANLLLNPGAEFMDAGGKPADWSSGFQQLFPTSFAWKGLSEEDPASIPGPANRGAEYFGAAGDADRMELSQVVDLSDVEGLVNSPALRATLSGWIGGVLGSTEEAFAQLVVLDKDSNPLSSATIGPILPIDRGGKTGFLFRSAEAPVPASTTKLLVTLRIASSQQSNPLTGRAGLDEMLLAISPSTTEVPLSLKAVNSSTPGQIKFSWSKIWTNVVLEYAPDLNGPWTEYGINPTINGDSVEAQVLPPVGERVGFWRLRRISS